MSNANRFIRKTYLPADGSDLIFNEYHHGIIVDNQGSSVVTFILDSDNITRSVPATAVRGYELTTPFKSLEITGDNYELHIFN
jgi:hypothetical protein